MDRLFSMEQLENSIDSNSGLLMFQQQHPWSIRHGPTSLLHLTLHSRACYSQIRIPDRLSRWNGDEAELVNINKFGNLSSYSQYSRHLDDIPIEQRKVDFDERKYDLENRTFTYRVDPESYELNKLPYLALGPEYTDRSKRVILL